MVKRGCLGVSVFQLTSLKRNWQLLDTLGKSPLFLGKLAESKIRYARFKENGNRKLEAKKVNEQLN